MNIYRGKNKQQIYLASLLYDAIEDSDLRSVKTLLSEKGADPNLVLPKTKISPFHLIIGNDSETFALEVTTLILQHGGNPNVQSDDGLTPIHIAAAWGRYEILKLLLACGGDPEIRDLNKNNALHYAMDENYMDCFDLLKFYVTDKSSYFHREKEDCINYDIKLDKILVSNGTTVGEYEIVNEYKNANILKDIPRRLPDLPQPDTKEYVMSWCNNIATSGISEGDSGESLKESDEERHKPPIDVQNICFRKVYRKRAKTLKKEISPSTSVASDSLLVSKRRDSSSDYMTCTSGISPDILERNVFDFESSCKSVCTGGKSEGISSSDLSFVSVSEVYKYVDKEEGIVLYEKRIIKTPVSDATGSESIFSSHHSLSESIGHDDIDINTIRKELTLLGFNPGPITGTTKRVYLRKLRQLKKIPAVGVVTEENAVTRVYSYELENTLKNPDWIKDLTTYKKLDEDVLREFATPDPSKKWREGNNKSSFTYLLLDPRLTENLPIRADSMKTREIWETFLSAVFYVGKGKRSRPYSHLYEAVTLWNQGQRSSECKKLNRILEIWKDDCGVVCLHLFQNTIPVEAYTREAAIIDALRLDNLSNVKSGNYYGVAATWKQKEKTMFGVYLLYKAMTIFLNEGERQLCPIDIN